MLYFFKQGFLSLICDELCQVIFLPPGAEQTYGNTANFQTGMELLNMSISVISGPFKHLSV